MKSLNYKRTIEDKMYWIDEKVYKETSNAYDDTISIYDGVYGDTLTFTRSANSKAYWDYGTVEYSC